MPRNGISLEQKQNWMRDSHASSFVAAQTPSAFVERHYSVAEVAAVWNLSTDAVRKIFQNEPGVLVLGEPAGSSKRRYTTLRIPESVLQRVHRRLANVGP